MKKLILIIILNLFLGTIIFALPVKTTKNIISKIDNNIFFMPNGSYSFKNENEKKLEINESFFEEIISGNIFVIFNWIKILNFEKSSNKIKIKLNNEKVFGSEISRKFISLFNKFLFCFNNLINNKIEIKYDKNISIDYKVALKTIYIKKIKGILIKNNISISDNLDKLLDISNYKLIYYNKYVFLGIVNPEKELFFDYYIYTSAEDVKERGFSEVFKQSNKNIRAELKPLVVNLFK